MKVLAASLVPVLFAGIALASQADQTPLASPNAGAGIRIVRLSQVRGTVRIDRNLGSDSDRGFEVAFANLPVTQGAKLKTEDGVAEVEFEDNSSLRLTPDTVVEFTQLGRAPSGFTESTVKVLQGTVFVSTSPARGNAILVASNEATLVVAPSTRMHFTEGSPRPLLAVLSGSVEAQVNGTATVVEKKKSLVFDPAGKTPPALVSHLDKTPYDAWDKQSVDYHQRYMNAGASASGGMAYGWSDLGYYGSFADAGCGSMWRPYLATAAWDPFANGLLVWYPQAGYSWVSPYPWGWLPYQSGNWVNCGGAGWGWQPGGSYVGLRNAVLIKHPIALPIRKPHGPVLVAVNAKPLVSSRFADERTFVFSKDSAGLGVPRETFGKLGKISTGVMEHGFVARPAYAAPVSVSTAAGQRTVPFARSGSGPAPAGSASPSGTSGGRGFSSAAASSPVSSGSHGSGGAASGGAAHH